MQKRTAFAWVVCAAWLSGCGVSVSSYVKPEAPWGSVRRMAILPFNVPSENPMQRQLLTELFAQELRKAGVTEVAEVPLTNPAGNVAWDLKVIGRQYQADAVISGSVDETLGTVLHVRVQDAATEDLLWSGTYLMGTRAELFSLRTQQQQIQRGLKALAKRLAGETGVTQAAAVK